MMDSSHSSASASNYEYDESAVPPPQWKSGNWLHDYFRRFDELHIDKEQYLEEAIKDLMQELATTKASFDSPENINTLRDEMHHWRRLTAEFTGKLREAEAFIKKQEAEMDEKNLTINELRRRCKELEEKETQIPIT